jgi:NAD(P)-dependent dehydrogenase (short-subunit alcohol dehydrogenase family)
MSMANGDHSGTFAGASAVVTGAGQGIGAAIAAGLAGAGAHVVVNGRHAETLERVCEAIRADGGSADCRVGDVTDLTHLRELMALAAGDRGAIDILINNAGIAGPTSPLADVTPQEWEQTIAVNLTGVFLACKAALPYLQRATRAKIVNIGSVTGKQPLVNRSPYAAAKLGVVGLTRTLALELGPSGMSVNVISPWLVEGQRLTDVIQSMSQEQGLSPEQMRDEMTRGTAFKRPVSQSDVVQTVLFLCSPGGDGLTGQDINVAAGAVMY